ncbi:DUF1761 domain-containing protein [Psychrobacillus sp. INOP01]|uniref:DUF1761 domain-containing protein n=1 Tax=Psychrobacillus sp. INOP01 TaxID=2829187 RepID=UPI001BAB0C9A|nr:DUF1761 domain-containing protein [Psychrobacillus sp. INOP01]QUG40051.1 DUF1761 domain-containing protein [Psychrobacillus sp. INOP01]
MIEWGNINYLPVLVGGIIYMVYGGIYYSLVLSNKNKHEDITTHESKGPFKYIYSVIMAFISSFLMALLVQNIGVNDLLGGAGIGFIVGLIITMVYLKNSFFGLISKKSFMIAIVDHLIIFTILGAIHGILI